MIRSRREAVAAIRAWRPRLTPLLSTTLPSLRKTRKRNMNPRHPLALLLVSVVALVVLAVAIVAVPPAQAAGANGSGPLYLPLVSGRGATEEPGVYTLAGVVQKGPFVQGTEITVRELDGTLTPTGRTVTGRIDDNSARFSGRSVLDYPFVELAAEGC